MSLSYQEEGNAAEGSEEPDMLPEEQLTSPPSHPPKSILKTNTRTTEVTNGYATEQVLITCAIEFITIFLNVVHFDPGSKNLEVVGRGLCPAVGCCRPTVSVSFY